MKPAVQARNLQTLEAFRFELVALSDLVASSSKKTLRNEDDRERFRNLFRSWVTNVEPAIKGILAGKRELIKLTAELEAIAKLASRYSQVSDYRKRLRKSRELADLLVLEIPLEMDVPSPSTTTHRGELFSTFIPDLPLAIVPNSLIGWRTKIEAFAREHGFDQSVFIMIRYRRRNASLIQRIKASLDDLGLRGIVASEHNLTDDLYNPIACLLCCSKGVAIFDRPEHDEKFNPNVAYELGMLHLLGRPCLILKHESIHALQTDILMKLYTSYSTPEDAAVKTREWGEKHFPENVPRYVEGRRRQTRV